MISTLLSLSVSADVQRTGEFEIPPNVNQAYLQVSVPFGNFSTSQSSFVVDGTVTSYSNQRIYFTDSFEELIKVRPSQGGAQTVTFSNRLWLVFSYTIPDYLDLSKPIDLSINFQVSPYSNLRYTSYSPLLFFASDPSDLFSNNTQTGYSYKYELSDVVSDGKTFTLKTSVSEYFSDFKPGQTITFGLFFYLDTEFSQGVFDQPLSFSIYGISSSLLASYDLTNKNLSEVNSALVEINKNLEYIKDPYSEDYQKQLEINNSKLDLSESIVSFESKLEQLELLENNFPLDDIDLSSVNVHLNNSDLLDYFSILYNIPVVISIFTVLGSFIVIKVLLHGGT